MIDKHLKSRPKMERDQAVNLIPSETTLFVTVKKERTNKKRRIMYPHCIRSFLFSATNNACLP